MLKNIPNCVKEAVKNSSSTPKDAKDTLSLDAPGTIDVLDNGDKLVYLTENLELVEKITDKNKTYSPPPKENLPYLLANSADVLKYIKAFKEEPGLEKELYKELIEYHKAASELPHEELYDLLVLWDFHCYLIEKLHFSPIIYLYAVKERGKSRTGKAMIFVSRRGVWTETVREPDVIRWGHDHRCVLGFDTKNAPKKFERANCDDLILARFEAGSISSRTLWPDRGAFRDTKTFNLFGPTVIATNRPVDDILESRSISIDMKPSGQRFDNPVIPENALNLKAKLSAFRIIHLQDKLVEAEKPAPGRLGDILGPIFQIMETYFPDKRAIFSNLLKTIIERKNEDAGDSLEAKMLETVISLENEVDGGFLSVEKIAGGFNTGRAESFCLTNETVGRILRALGFEKKRRAGGVKIFYDMETIQKLKESYGLLETNETNKEENDVGNVGSVGEPDIQGKTKKMNDLSAIQVVNTKIEIRHDKDEENFGGCTPCSHTQHTLQPPTEEELNFENTEREEI